jgi:endothelin-converting enzyme
MAHEDAEREPLLGGSQENERNEPEALANRAGKWVARNAVLIFMSLLILAVLIVICIFFGSKL